jgi:arginine/lysine/ornithine decarboxylase
MYNTPLYNAVAQYAAKDTARFHMPGHKGRFCRNFLEPVLPFDLTEIDETDNLYISGGVIGEAESLAAKAFGAAHTAFSAGGATLALQAAMYLASQTGQKMLIDRNCHKSVIHACALLDIEPVWIYPEINSEFNIPCGMHAADFEKAAKCNPDAKSLLITSPNYYGSLAELKEICNLAKDMGIITIIDNSHGSHLAFYQSGELHPIRMGGDLVIDSLHKTLPVLTGGAMLLSGGRFNRQDLLGAMSLFGSTSPSYLIMASIDYARGYMESEGNKVLQELDRLCCEFRNWA